MSIARVDLVWEMERESNTRTPEQDLFFAVVLQAFNDMRGLDWVDSNVCEKAEQWLLQDSDDFKFICFYAGVDDEKIRLIARKYKQYLATGGSRQHISLSDE